MKKNEIKNNFVTSFINNIKSAGKTEQTNKEKNSIKQPLNFLSNILKGSKTSEDESVVVDIKDDEKIEEKSQADNSIHHNKPSSPEDGMSDADSKYVLRMKEAQPRLREAGFSATEIAKIMEVLSFNKSIGSLNFSEKQFDRMNECVFGPVKDQELRTQLNEIGKKYGVEIKADNDFISTEYAKQHKCYDKVLTSDKVVALEDALAQMKKMGEEIPPNIYLTELFEQNEKSTTLGQFWNKRPDTIYINMRVEQPRDTFMGTIFHEAAHMADYKPDSGKYRSDRYDDIEISSDKEYVGDNEENQVSTKAIKKFISGYALTDNQEFVAEVTILLVNETIVKDKDGNYTINPDKLFEKDGSMKYNNAVDKNARWDGDDDDLEKLNKIMQIYERLAGANAIKPTVIR